MQSMKEQGARFSNYPRDNVSWYQATAFCRWLTKKLPELNLPLTEAINRWEIRLPTPEEWQAAASGGLQDRSYPWGSKWDMHLANTMEAGLGKTTAVGMYPQGSSPNGVLDMAGNVWEWCLSDQAGRITSEYNMIEQQILCGGSYFAGYEQSQCNSTIRIYAHYRGEHYGFRVVLAQRKQGKLGTERK
jgi:formylglycine-generating enzyme required for sulfatase activity